MRRRGNWRPGFAQRFAKYDSGLKQALTNRHVVWMHAVSVGEVNLCTQLIRALEPRVPNVKFVVSTTTTTGMAELRRHLPTHVSKIYYPVDRRKYVNRALATINPEGHRAGRGGNLAEFHLARAKTRHPGFSGQRAAVRPFVSRLQTVWISVPAVVRVVCRRRRAKRSGRRALARSRLPSRSHPRRRQLEIRRGETGRTPRRSMFRRCCGSSACRRTRRSWSAGSTHDGEEIILAEIAQNLRARFPKLFLVLVPRHFERCRQEVGAQLRERGVKFFYRSEIAAGHAIGAKAKLNACSSTRPASCDFFTNMRQLCSSAKA